MNVQSTTQLFGAAILLLLTWVTAHADDDDVIGIQDEITYQPMELEHSYETDACQAQLELEYYQKGSSAHVDANLTNEHCAASSGTYVIEVRYRGAGGEASVTSFDETWERSDADPIAIARDYFIGDDVDIVRVRSRELRCVCSDQDGATADDDQAD